MEVFVGRPLALENVMEEIQPLKVMYGDLVFHVVFNIIQCFVNIVVRGFLWLELHNLDVDWNL